MKTRALILMLGAAAVVFSQAWGGEIVCQALESGRPVISASVTLEPGGMTMLTDTAGICRFTGLALGNYSLNATKRIAGQLYGAKADNVVVAPTPPLVNVRLNLTRAILLSQYLPIRVDDFWLYKVTITQLSSIQTKQRSERAVGTESIGSDTAIVVQIQDLPTGDAWQELMLTSNNGHTRYREVRPSDTINYEPPLHLDNLCPLGYVMKAQSVRKHSNGSPDEPVVFVGSLVRFENVTVPAGTFRDCPRLEFQQQSGTEKRRMSLWLAYGLGIVRAIERSATKENKRELLQYNVRPFLPPQTLPNRRAL